MGWRLLNYVHIALFRVTFNKKEKRKKQGTARTFNTMPSGIILISSNSIIMNENSKIRIIFVSFIKSQIKK